MKRISNFGNFKLNESQTDDFEIDYSLDENEGSGLSHFEEACLEEGIDFSDYNSLNEDFEILESELDQYAINEGKFGQFLKKVGGKALNLIKNNIGKIAGLLGVSLAGPLGPLAGLLGKGLTNMLSKLKPGAKLDKGGLQQAAAGSPEITQVSGTIGKTIEKLAAEMKKDPSAFMKGKFLESLKGLTAISSAANKSIGSVAKEAAASGVAQPAKKG